MDLLKDVRVDWITIESAEDRHTRMNTLFETLGFRNSRQINGEIADKENKTFIEIQNEKNHKVADSHIFSLEKPGHVLILEDDVWFTHSFNPILSHIPEDADAVYIGTSVNGMVDGISTPGGTQIAIIDEYWDKPLNMLGLHSILYLTESYKEKTIQNLLKARENDMFCDEPVAIDMSNHNIYSCVFPMLYQKDGYNDQVTTIPLRAIQKN